MTSVFLNTILVMIIDSLNSAISMMTLGSYFIVFQLQLCPPFLPQESNPSSEVDYHFWTPALRQCPMN